MEPHPASQLNTRLTLQQPVLTTDTQGGYSKTWQDVATLWAKLSPQTGRDITRESFTDARVQARITHRVWLRYLSGVTTAMRLLLENGRILHIHAVVDAQERHEMLEILAEEGAGE